MQEESDAGTGDGDGDEDDDDDADDAHTIELPRCTSYRGGRGSCMHAARSEFSMVAMSQGAEGPVLPRRVNYNNSRVHLNASIQLLLLSSLFLLLLLLYLFLVHSCLYCLDFWRAMHEKQLIDREHIDG